MVRVRIEAAVLRASAIADGELVAWVWGKEFGDEAKAVGEGLRGEQRVLALAEFGVVEVRETDPV